MNFRRELSGNSRFTQLLCRGKTLAVFLGMISNAWLSTWIGLLFGIVLAIWPHSIGSALSLFLVAMMLRPRLLFLLGFLVGLSRLGGSVFLPQDVLTSFQKPAFYAVEVVSESEWGSRARISENAFVELNQRFDVGTRLRGVANLKPVSTTDVVLGLPKERWLEDEKILGRLQWIYPPEILNSKKSLREKIRSKILSSFTNLNYPLLTSLRRAFLLADPSEVPQKIWDSLNYLGLSHFIIFAGFHLAALLAALSFLYRKLIARYWAYARDDRFLRLGLAVLLLLFCFIVDIHPPFLRAFGGFFILRILSLYVPSLHRLKATEKLAILGIAFAVVHPLLVVKPTYALTFGATFALLRASEWRFRPPLFAMVFLVFLIVSPVTNLFSLGMNPLSPIFNALVAPLFAVLILPLLLFAPDSMANASLQFFFQGLESLAHFLLKIFPLTHHTPESFCIVLCLVFFALCQNEWSLRKRFVGLTTLVILSQVGLYIPLSSSSRLSLQFLDVGQGDGILISMEGKHIVIDGGGSHLGKRQVLPSLIEGHGNSEDLWILTHFDEDHRGNFQDLVPSFTKPKEIWIPRFDASRFGLWLRTLEIPMHSVQSGPRKLCSEHFCLESWSSGTSPPFTNVANRDSVVLLLSEKSSHRVLGLFLGDLPSAQEKELLLAHPELKKQAVELVKVGHHGSSTSSSNALLLATHTRNFFISCGRNNRFRFPTESTLERLEIWGGKVYRTDIGGNLKVDFDF